MPRPVHPPQGSSARTRHPKRVGSLRVVPAPPAPPLPRLVPPRLSGRVLREKIQNKEQNMDYQNAALNETAIGPLDLKTLQTIRNIIVGLNTRIRTELSSCNVTGFTCWTYDYPEQNIIAPGSWHWIACYATRDAANEYWVHIDLVMRDLSRRNIGNLRAWNWADALTLANAATLTLHGH